MLLWCLSLLPLSLGLMGAEDKSWVSIPYGWVQWTIFNIKGAFFFCVYYCSSLLHIILNAFLRKVTPFHAFLQPISSFVLILILILAESFSIYYSFFDVVKRLWLIFVTELQYSLTWVLRAVWYSPYWRREIHLSSVRRNRGYAV